MGLFEYICKFKHNKILHITNNQQLFDKTVTKSYTESYKNLEQIIYGFDYQIKNI